MTNKNPRNFKLTKSGQVLPPNFLQRMKELNRIYKENFMLFRRNACQESSLKFQCLHTLLREDLRLVMGPCFK
jgi:hypothetical protein